MAKPRVIIADTDSTYIQPFIARLIEDYQEKIDLEVITDSQYFNELFASPQKADVLIVCDELYSSDLNKHNLTHLFVLSENTDIEEATNDLNTERIYKYSSVKEIFNIILGKSRLTFENESNTKRECQVVLFCGANGGSGKTTLALAASRVLVQNYKKTLYINASKMHTFQSYLENQDTIKASEVYAKLQGLPDRAYDSVKSAITSEGFDYLPPFKAPLMSFNLDFSIYWNIAVSAKKSRDYDFVVIDCDETFGEEMAKLLNIADKAVIVCNQNRSSLFATSLLANQIDGVDSDKYLFICNNFYADNADFLNQQKGNLTFTISEYVKHIGNIETLSIEQIAKDEAIERLSLWMM